MRLNLGLNNGRSVEHDSVFFLSPIITEVMTMKTIQITFDDILHSNAKAAAHACKVTLGDLVRLAVAEHVRRLDAAREPDEKLAQTGGGK